MLLTLHERERLMIYTGAKLAEERRERGVLLNLPEATALITSFLLEGARNGRSVEDLMDAGRRVLGRDEVMDGVPEMLTQVQALMPLSGNAVLVTSLAPDALTLRQRLDASLTRWGQPAHVPPDPGHGP